MKPINPLDVKIKISIQKQGAHLPGNLGRGSIALLKGVKTYGSLNQAAKALNMAYSKAWKLIKESEAHAGAILIERHGAHGSFLTQEGDMLLSLYLQLEEETLMFCKRRFEELIEEKLR